MASLKKGQGPVMTGVIGNIVVARRKNTIYHRRRPVVNPDNISVGQRAQHLRMKVASPFVVSMQDVLYFTFNDPARSASPYNLALGHVMSNALVGEYPNYSIRYESVSISTGQLPPPVNAAAETYRVNNTHAIRFTWEMIPHVGMSSPHDGAILVAYHANTSYCYSSIDDARRADQEGLLELPNLTGEEVHTWLGFVSAKGNRFSPSVYTGKLIL